MRNRFSTLKASFALACFFSLASHAHAITITSLSCAAVPNSATDSYNTTTTCNAVVNNPGIGSWQNAVGQDCSSVCASKGLVNAYSPDGFKCASGEERPKSGMGVIDYSPTGCWGACSVAFGPSGAVSVGGRCYHPTQKRDNDRTDTTVACYCVKGDAASNTADISITSNGTTIPSTESVTPAGFSSITSQALNDSANRLVRIVGVIPVGSSASLSMKIKIQGACATSGAITASVVIPGVVTINPPSQKTISVALPACPPVFPQCSDGKDNDQDGVYDRTDPGCWTDANNPNTYSASRTAESAATTQCQDNADNDGDVVKDAADPGCINPGGASANARFIDARMNDWFDTQLLITSGQTFKVTATGTANLINSNPGITVSPGGILPASLTNNCRTPGAEALPIGALVGKIGPNGAAFLIGSSLSKVAAATGNLFISINDARCPGDNSGGFSLSVTGTTRAYDKTRNLESSGSTECQDTKDNDNDGLVDAKDPGCFTNPKDASTYDRTRNNEGAAAPGDCIDGKDNDNDGVADKNDPGCWTNVNDANTYNPYGGPESTATTQCQDTKDNDGDGLADASDPGCLTNVSNPSSYDRTRNNEGAANPPQCADGKDNDNDNLIDLADPGCSNASDMNEGDEPAKLTVGVECVTDNTDKTKTAYFSYNNVTGSDISVSTDTKANTLNAYVSNGTQSNPPTSFKAGMAKGTVVATFSGDSLTWVIRSAGSALSQVTANAQTPRCGRLTLNAECRGYKDGVMQVRFGYTNPNAFPLVVAAGPNNTFSPNTADRGQPRTFFAGSHGSSFEAPLTSDSETITWSVIGASASAAPTLQVCNGLCTDVPTSSITGGLDAIAGQLSGVMKRAAALLASSSATIKGSSKKRSRIDAQRANKRADEFVKLVASVTIEYPAVVKTCAAAPQLCARVDRGVSLDKLQAAYADMRRGIIRIVNRAYFRNTGGTNKKDPLIQQATALSAQGSAELLKLPRVAVECK